MHALVAIAAGLLMRSCCKSSFVMKNQRATICDGKCTNKQGLCTNRECCSRLLEFICITQGLTGQSYQNECTTSNLQLPPQDHLACGLSDCLSSSRSAIQFPDFRKLVYELTAGQVGTGFAWKLYMLRSGHPGLRYQGCFGLAPGNAERRKSF